MWQTNAELGAAADSLPHASSGPSAVTPQCSLAAPVTKNQDRTLNMTNTAQVDAAPCVAVEGGGDIARLGQVIQIR